MKRYIPLAFLFGIIWCFIHGNFSILNLILGSFVGLIAIKPFLFLYEPEEDFKFFSPPPRILSMIKYFLILVKEIIKAAIVVSKIVLHPHMDIKPGIIAVPINCKTDLGITGIANAITLTPGTITLDISPDKSILYVHCIDASDPEEVINSIHNNLEKYVLEAFE